MHACGCVNEIQIIMNTLDPTWVLSSLPQSTVCNGNFDRVILVRVP